MAYIRFKIQLQLTFSQSAEGPDQTGILDAVLAGEDGRQTLDALGGISVDSRVGVIVTPMAGTVVDPVLLAGHAVCGVGVGRGGRHGWGEKNEAEKFCGRLSVFILLVRCPSVNGHIKKI